MSSWIPPSPDVPGASSAPTNGLAVVAGMVLYLLVAVLAAVLEVLLVPVRVGTVVVPVTVVLAAVTMVALPALASGATGRTLGAFVPVGAWIVTVVVLSQARPEGDVLLLGSAPLVYVTYAMLAIGAVCGIATVVSLDRRRIASAAAARSVSTAAAARSVGLHPIARPTISSLDSAPTAPATASPAGRKRRR